MEHKLPFDEFEQTCVEEENDANAADLEFYETIEAPKFVDFTRPNHFCPDDRYWFCSRVGCTQNHASELDSEAIYKDFVIRVMAARSPNVRFQRALRRKPLSDSKKCPMSAPPKSSKSRIPRLALVSSVSRKLIDDVEKDTTKPVPVNPASKPKTRVKHVPAKYMTSPGKKKRISPKPHTSQSVKNPKKTSITIQKNNVVAKALMFSSPKKAVKAKISELTATPVTKLCEGLKKLAITSEKKEITKKQNVRKLLPPKKEITRKQSVRKMLPSDGNLRKKGPSTSKKEPALVSGRPLTVACSEQLSSTTQTSELASVPDSEYSVAFQEPTVIDQNKGNKSSITEDDIENRKPEVVVDDVDNDDKENTLNTADIRKVNGNILSNHRLPVKSKVNKTIQKVRNGDKKSMKENCPAVINQAVKYKKLKPTNPKPFRLRTDERGILKEATLEKRVNSHENSSATSENSQPQCTENAAREKTGKNIEDGTLKKVHFILVQSKYKKTSKETSSSENRTERAKPSNLQKQPVPHQRATDSRVKPRQLCVAEKTVTTMLKPKVSRLHPKDIATTTNKASVTKPMTLPREPIFHTWHKPKTVLPLFFPS